MAKTKKTTPKNTRKKSAAIWPWLTQTTKLSGVLFVLSVLIYANTFNHGFAQDDAIVITDNMFTTEGVAGLPGLFTYDTFYGFFKKADKDKLVAGGRYRPLTPAMFALEYELYGENPRVMHFFNALWYGLLAVVLYGVLLALFKARSAWDKGLSPYAIYAIPLLATLVFAMHPLHTEAVANIKGRDEIMTLLGSLGALWLILKGGPLRLGLAGLCFFAALLAKENAITFLGVVPVALYFFTNDKWTEIIGKMSPLLPATILFLLIRFSILGLDFGAPSGELMNNPFLKIEQGRWVPFSGGEKAATITYTLGKYAQLLAAPVTLTHDYYPRHVKQMSWSDWQVLLSMLLYLGMIIYAIWGLRQKNIGSFAVIYYLMTLSIVSNIVFPVGTNMSERFLFMPSVGFALLLAWAAVKWIADPKFNVGLLVGISLVFAVLTLQRNPAWDNNFTLFKTDIKTSPNSAKLRNAMAGELSVQWINLPEEQREGNKNMLQEALGHLNEAVRLHPTYKQAYFIRGNILNYLQQYEASIESYQQALRISPDYPDADRNMMLTYRDAGRFYGEKQGDIVKAITYLERAYAGLPEDYETIRTLGVAYGISGNTPKATELFTKNTQLHPEIARTWFDLGTAYMMAGNVAQGEEYIAKAKSIDPDIKERN